MTSYANTYHCLAFITFAENNSTDVSSPTIPIVLGGVFICGTIAVSAFVILKRQNGRINIIPNAFNSYIFQNVVIMLIIPKLHIISSHFSYE